MHRSWIFRRLLGVTWIASLASLHGTAVSQTPAELPQCGPYFPVDDRIVEDRWHLRRFVVPAERHPQNPVLTKAHDWEGSGPSAMSVLRDPADGLFKMWYSVWNADNYYNKRPFSYNVCYAESADGIQWRRPPLGVFEHEEDARNNIIKLGKEKTQNIDVELLPGDGTARKFVAIHNDRGGVRVSTSTDGKTFHVTDAPPAVSFHSDTHNNFLYDEVRNRWLLYLRPEAFAAAYVIPKVGRRRVAVQESDDLVTWTKERTVLVPEENDPDHFYGMTVFRRGDLFFGLLQLYDKNTERVEIELAWSGDGYHWQRLPLRDDAKFLSCGAAGAWDDGMVYPADRPVEVGDELWFYYGGWDGPHDVRNRTASVGIAVAKRDRFVGVRAEKDSSGRLLTRPLPVTGDLYVNASAAGSLRVGVYTADDQPLEGWQAEDCQEFTGDALDAPIRWGEKSLQELKGQTVRLRFHLDAAELYSLSMRP